MARTAAILGLISAVGPLGIDLYLPSFPTVAADLHTTPAAVQSTIVVFFAAMAFGQIFTGPISDQVGRRPPMLLGLGLFALASMGCALAPNIQTLLVMRIIQGLGASAGMTLTRAMVRDMYTGPDAAKLMSLMLLVFGVSPLFAPLLGGLILTLGGWRLIFWVLTALVLAGLLLAAVLLRETHPHHKRIKLSPSGSAQLFGRLFRDRRFMGLTLSSGSWSGATFTFLATSSFVFTGEYHLSPMAYGVLFGLCATGMIATAQLNATVMRKIGAELQIRLTSATAVGVAAVMLGLVLTHNAPLWVMGLGTFLLFCCQGLNITPATVTALDSQGANAGSAASLMGTLQMTFGATASGLVSNLFAPHAATLVGAQLSCLIIGAIACRVAFWRKPGA